MPDSPSPPSLPLRPQTPPRISALPPVERRVAILETDSRFRRQMCEAFDRDGWRCRSYTQGRALLQDLQRYSPHVLLACTQLPDLDCDTLVRQIRNMPPGAHTPELVLTNSLPSSGLSEHAAWATSRLLPRPFSCQELLQHVRSLLNQPYLIGLVDRHHLLAESRSLVEVGPIAVEVHQAAYMDLHAWQNRQGRVWVSGREIHTTVKEYRLAEVFFQRLGLPVPREDLIQAAWAVDPPDDSRTVDAHVSRLRTRLALVEARGFRLRTRYKFGYQLDYIS